MDISSKKIELIEWLTRLQDKKLLQQIDRLKKESVKNAYQLRTPGSVEEIETKLDRSDKDIKAGRVSSQADVEEAFKEKYDG